MAVPVLHRQLLLVYCRSDIPVAGNSVTQPQHLLHAPWRSLRFPHSWKARWEQQSEPEAEGEVVPDPRREGREMPAMGEEVAGSRG